MCYVEEHQDNDMLHVEYHKQNMLYVWYVVHGRTNKNLFIPTFTNFMMYVVWIQEHGLHTEQHKTSNIQHIERFGIHNIQEAKEHKDSDMDEAQEGMNKNMK